MDFFSGGYKSQMKWTVHHNRPDPQLIRQTERSDEKDAEKEVKPNEKDAEEQIEMVGLLRDQVKRVKYGGTD